MGENTFNKIGRLLIIVAFSLLVGLFVLFMYSIYSSIKNDNEYKRAKIESEKLESEKFDLENELIKVQIKKIKGKNYENN